MASRTERTKERVDRDGVRIVEDSGVRRGVWLLVLAMGLVGVALIVLIRPVLDRAPADGLASRPAGHVAAGTAGGSRAAQPPAKPAGPVAVKPLHARFVPRVKEPPPAQESGSAQDEGPAPPNEDAAEASDTGPEERTGIALFPPPGTDPPKPGIIVPDDFELPPGYVRHYQVTDDGQRLPAILMFHPDYEFTDEHGALIQVPKDRVVPPELAPPGLSIQMLEVPESNVPMIEPPANQGAQDSAP